ncbi:hypothetical protein [Vitiosangium sp. GDMCC 1.1324]|uniref:hypothetical protein n=1 Tax=Vitiosangium sp. (strain GDMCC 1.1324) TaxID=2138576 RepID=UPI000D395172|nr:hypothetical protein [Vitiosangium sp. GDMCC 1.1324]PTL78232.1 hypothetical protein DAT35_39955 [Vitiosangium sp. GDMCC 1.1324]
MNMSRLLVALVALLLLPAAARAEGVCEQWIAPALAEGPVTFGFQSADVSTGRRACPRTEVGLGVQGGAIIETQNFYGAVTAAGLLSGSVAVRPDLEVFATLEALRFQYVQNATLTGTNMSLGQLTLGGTYVALTSGSFVLSPSVRLELPTSFASPRTRTVGGEIGAAALYRSSERFEVHGYAGVDASLGLGASASLPRAGFLVNVGAEYALFSGFAAVLDANVHFGRRDVLDYVAPAVGLRFRAGEHFGAELGASLPLLGAERALAIGGLKLTWRM